MGTLKGRTDADTLRKLFANIRDLLAALSEALEEIHEITTTPWTSERLEEHVNNLRANHVELANLRNKVPASERTILRPLLEVESLPQKKYEASLEKTPYEFRAALGAWSKTCKRYGVTDPIRRTGPKHRDGRRFSLSAQARAVLSSQT